MEIDNLPLKRDVNGQLQLSGIGPTNLRIDFGHVLGSGDHGVVFRGALIDMVGETLVTEVAIKTHRVATDPDRNLRDEAEMHAKAWSRLSNVLRPFGFLPACEASNTPEGLVMVIGMPFQDFLAQAGPLSARQTNWTRAIARVIFEGDPGLFPAAYLGLSYCCTDTKTKVLLAAFLRRNSGAPQLLRFIVAGDKVNIMHKDIKLENIFVCNGHDAERAELAVGNFGGAEQGKETVEGGVTYGVDVYTWNHTSPRMVSIVYNRIIARGVPTDNIEIDSQLCFFNDLFGWARVTFSALIDRGPPDPLYGPSDSDYAVVPSQGHNDVLDAVHHLLTFALDLLTPGSLEDVADSAYVRNLDWYEELPSILASVSID